MHLIPLPAPRSMRAIGDSSAPLLPSSDRPFGPLPLSALAGRHVVIEERLDGAEVELAFDARGAPLLNAGGRPLAGGFGDRPLIPLKLWTLAHERRLNERLGERHELRGSWSYAMRQVWYDRLPHYFNETEVLDRATGYWLSTRRRQALLAGSPVLSVPVLYEGPMPTLARDLECLGARSIAKSVVWRASFAAATRRESLSAGPWWRWAELSDRAFALIVKVEDEARVLARYLLVPSALTTLAARPATEAHAGALPRNNLGSALTEMPPMADEIGDPGHRPLLPNALAPGADLFADRPRVSWGDLGARLSTSLASASSSHRPRSLTAGKSTGTSKATFT
jgi:hypothetical protein